MLAHQWLATCVRALCCRRHPAPVLHIVGFFAALVWPVPFGLMLSLAANDYVLPGAASGMPLQVQAQLQLQPPPVGHIKSDTALAGDTDQDGGIGALWPAGPLHQRHQQQAQQELMAGGGDPAVWGQGQRALHYKALQQRLQQHY